MKGNPRKSVISVMLALCLLLGSVLGIATPASGATAPPGIPGSTKAQYTSSTSIIITWSKVTGATGYVVYKSLQPAGSYQRVKVTSTLSATDTVKAGTLYYYKARAYTKTTDGNIYGTPSAAFTAAPGIPGNTNAQYTSLTSVKITWNKAAGATGYVVYRSLQPEGGYERVKVTSALSATDSSVTAGTLYYYKARAYTKTTGGNIYGTPSAAFTAPAYAAPGIPGSPVAKAGVGGSISLSWKAVSGATGYVVYRYLRDSSTAVRYAVVKSTAFTDKNIKANTFYKYKVRAYTTSGGKNIYGTPSGFFYTPEIPISGLAASKVSALSLKRAWHVASGTTGTKATVLKLVYKNSLRTTYKSSTGKVYNIYPACYLAIVSCKPENFRNTCAELTYSTDEALTNSMAKKVGALVAVNNEFYAGHWDPNSYARFYSAGPVIKEGKIVQNKGGSGAFTLVYKNGTWLTGYKVSSKTQAEALIRDGVHFSIGSEGGYAVYWGGKTVRESPLPTQTILLNNLRNHTYVAQIDANNYLLAVGEFMPQIMLENVLKAYGAKNYLEVNGGNCAYMYVRNCGNVTGSSGASLTGLDKLNMLETEWQGLHGYLAAGKSGGPCPAKDIVFVK